MHGIIVGVDGSDHSLHALRWAGTESGPGIRDKAASEISETVPEVTVSVTTGEAAEELVTASRDADMLVVGSRGSGGFSRLLLAR
jgi:nucleotide-binding universal stress UspA family protein